MIYHIVVGDAAAAPLRKAIEAAPAMTGEVVAMKDILHIGPIKRGEGQSFSSLRSAYWQSVVPHAQPQIEVDDLERLLEISNELYKDSDAIAWCWMAPLPADVCAYYWMLPYLSKHSGRFFIVNLANLPFLNEAGKVFYPRSIAEILPRELQKARRLARPVTPSEAEPDGEAWAALVEENGGIRTLEGGKKLRSRDEDYYDDQLLAALSGAPQKASRVLQTVIHKSSIPTGDTHLAWRLRTLAEQGAILLDGDPLKPYREWNVRLPAGSGEEVPAGAGVSLQDAV